MATLHAGAGNDPFVGGIKPPTLRIIFIGNDLGRRVMRDRTDSDSGSVQRLAVSVTGVIVVDFDDLASVVYAAIRADEVRTLRLMTLRAIDGSNRVQYPVGRTTAARFATRCLPFRICHYFLQL